jgi:UDP-N-acetylglucosamine 2-epimerase (non-hydrolysing)
MRILSVVGTRPNFVKIAPIAAAARAREGLEHVLVHTGQHYDDSMSQIFFDELDLDEPLAYLEVGSASHNEQTARVMQRLEPVLLDVRPDVVLVPGDVNSTLGAALAAVRLGFRVGHVEAGLRSFDRSMPEEVNRVLVDQISDLLFIHSPEARTNLVREGVDPARIHDVGNTMIDTLTAMRPRIDAIRAYESFGLTPGRYVVATLHRPALVDGPLLDDALAALEALAEELPVLLPLHPRTRAALDARATASRRQVTFTDPLGYLEFLSLVSTSAGVLTDSGGLQEETTYLGIPCFTLRENTERPITVDQGTNVLLGLDPRRVADVARLIRTSAPAPLPIPGWDGHAASRILDVLLANERA